MKEKMVTGHAQKADGLDGKYKKKPRW